MGEGSELVIIPLMNSHKVFLQLANIIISEGFPSSSVSKESTCNAGDLGSISGLGRSPGEGKGYPLQYSGLENSMDCVVHGVTKSWTRLSDFHFYFNYFWGFSGCSDGKESACNAGDLGFVLCTFPLATSFL